MKQDTQATTPSSSARAEAAVWVARLHGASRTRALEAGWRKWMEANPAHARAFEIATEAWEIAGGVRWQPASRAADPFQDAPRRQSFRRTYFSIAAALLVAIAAGWLYWLNRESPIATAVGEQRSLTLADGTRIYLNTDTRLFVRETAKRRDVQLESGEALFDVAQDLQRPFVVTAGSRQIMALGTSFVIRRDPRQLVVTLMEGKVAVTSVGSAARAGDDKPTQTGATVMIPGQRITFNERAAPQVDAPLLEKVTAWRRGEVVLDRTRLEDAVSEMNRYSAVKLRIEDRHIEDILVSGIFRAGDSARFARAVGETYHLSVEEEPQGILISRPPPR